MNQIIDRPKGRSLKPLRALWPYVQRYRGVLVLALGALLVASAALLVLPLAFRNRHRPGHGRAGSPRRSTSTSSHSSRRPWRSACSPPCASISSRGSASAWSRTCAPTIYARVIRMDPTFFEVTRTGEVLSRLTTDTTLVQVDRRRESVDHVALDRSSWSARSCCWSPPARARRHDPAGDSAGDVPADRCSVAGCALCRANRRIASPTPAASPAKRSTRSRPCRHSRSKAAIARASRGVEDSFAVAIRRTRMRAHADGGRHDDDVSAQSRSCSGRARTACWRRR